MQKDNEVKKTLKKNSKIGQDIIKLENVLGDYSLGELLPNPDPVLKKYGNISEAYELIESDAFVYGLMDRVKKGVDSLEYSINRNDCSEEEYELAQNIMEKFFKPSIKSSIIKGNWYGYQPIQIEWEFGDKYWLPKNITSLPRTYFGFNPKSELFHYKNDNTGVEKEVQEPNVIFMRREVSFENPYGIGILSKCFWNTYFKKNGMKFFAVFVEKYGMPALIGVYEAMKGNSEDIEKGNQKTADMLLDTLEALLQDSATAMPDTFEIKSLDNAKKTSADIYESFINMCTKETSLLILGHAGAAVETPGKLGNEVNSTNATSDTIDSHSTLIKDFFDKVLKYVHEYNFSGEEIPTINLVESDSMVAKIKQVEYDLKLQDLGISFSKSYIARKHGLSEDEFEMIDGIEGTEAKASFIKGIMEAKKKDKSDLDTVFKNRSVLDEVVDIITSDAETQRDIMKPMVEPIIKFIEKQTSYEDMLSGLKDLFPKMKTKEFESYSTRVLNTVNAYGKISSQVEDEEA